MSTYISFNHPENLEILYVDEAFNKAPDWAINVKPYDGEYTYAHRATLALKHLPAQFHSFVISQAYDRGHSSSEEEVDMLITSIAYTLIPSIENFRKSF